MSEANETGSKSKLIDSKANLLASSSNLSKIKSKANLGSRVGSRFNLSKSKNALNSDTEIPAATNTKVFENTYQLKPEKKFPTLQARNMAQSALDVHLKGIKYDFALVPELTQKIANELLQSVKTLECDRYKLLVDVHIGEFKGQGIKVASRAVWDTTTDTYASASFKNVPSFLTKGSLFAVAMVFALYYE